MRKQLGFLILGAALGAVGTYALTERPVDAAFSAAPERDIGEVAPLSVQAAEQHRAERYAEITTIAETLALPTDFAQTEALYVIAGRSSSAELQDLIYDAARISERLDRSAALQILFLRLTELDPMSAVAIAQSPAFANERGFERAVWENWGRVDLDAALDAASGLSGADRRRAARSLYASLRGIDDTQAQYIESTLGIAPDSNARMLRIAALAQDNPIEALAYVESFPNTQERYQYASSLAMTLAQRLGPEQASQYSELVQDELVRQVYVATLNNLRARNDPASALERVLSDRITDQSRRSAAQAYQQLVAQDLDAAETWFQRASDPRLKDTFGQLLAARMAAEDPTRALAWVKANDTGRQHKLLGTVLTQVARNDPELALMEAQTIAHYQTRESTLSSVMRSVASDDPVRAAQLIEMLGDSGSRQSLITLVAQQWAQRDWRSAYDWIDSTDVPNRRAALDSIGTTLLNKDLDAAAELLTRLPESSSASLRLQIASRYAQQRSVAEAERFVSQFAGDADYAQLLGNVATAAAAQDSTAAIRIARRIESAELRDRIYSETLSQQANRDPLGAMQQLDLISTEAARSSAMQMIINRWQRSDPTAAMDYVENLPAGQTRDMGISTAIRSLEPGSDRAMALARSIANAQLRQQTIMNQFYRVANNDPARAQRLLGSVDLDPEYRRQIQSMIDSNR
ncbi:MAG: hypothetical protein AAFY69_13215 [Pseudomonadota bacterium]